MAAPRPRRVATPEAAAPRLSLPARMALRDVWQHRWRSLLIVLLIALPVATVVALATVQAAHQPTPRELIGARLGDRASARIAPLGERCVQRPLQEQVCAAESDGIVDPTSRPALATLLPPGASTIELDGTPAQVSAARPGGLEAFVHVWTGPVLSSDLADAFELRDGKAPTGEEVAISAALAGQLNLGPGDALRLDGVDRPIAAVVDADLATAGNVFLAPGAPSPSAPAHGSRLTYTYVLGPAMTWDEVRALNAKGYGVFSRAVALDPPTLPEQDLGVPVSRVATVGFVGVVAAAVVVAICGAAFMISVKQQRRSLGLLAASGAESGTLKAVMRLAGMWLGAAGAVLGVVLGLAAGWIGCAALASTYQFRWWGWHVPWFSLLAAAILGLASAVLAAMAPSRELSRLDALAAIRTAVAPASPARLPWRSLAVGVLGTAVCAAPALLARAVDLRLAERPAWSFALVLLALGGGGLLFLGLLGASGWAMQALGRVVPTLSLRLALRDGARNRGRTLASVAAVAAVSLLAAVGLMLWGSYQADFERNRDRLSPVESAHALVRGEVDKLGGGAPRALDPAAVRAAMSGIAPVRDVIVLVGAKNIMPAVPAANQCPDPRLRDDWRCDPEGVKPVLAVADEATLPLLLGRDPTTEEKALLARGTALALSRHLVAGNRCELATASRATMRRDPLECQQVSQTPPTRYAALILPPSALPVEQRTSSVLVAFEEPLTYELAERVRAAAAGLPGGAQALTPTLQAPRDRMVGWQVAGSALAAVLLVAAITTALALTDARADEATLAAVGAAPGFRKRSAGAQMLVVVGAGLLVGLTTGVAATAAFLAPQGESLPLDVPWGPLLALALATPVVGAGVAWLVTPARVTLVRRLE